MVCVFFLFLLLSCNCQTIFSHVSNKKHPLKILFVVSNFPPHSGTAVLNQITGLIDCGHDVYIYAKRLGNMEWAHPNMTKYNLLERTYCNDRGSVLKNLPPDLETYDIIYCQFGYRGEEFAEIKKRKRFKARLVTCFRGADISKYLRNNPYAYNLLFKIGDLFLPVCDYFRTILIKKGCDPCKIIVHHSAIDCEKFSFKPRSLAKGEYLCIVTVGRLIEKKGIKYAIKAVAQVLKEYPAIEYNIVGFGPLEQELNDLIKKLGIADKVKLLGYATEDEVAKILDRSHLFILPSITAKNGDSEGIANALKEAMARGLPVISTYHAGTSELVEHGVSGYLAPEHNVHYLVRYIKLLIKKSKLWPKMGKAGREKVLSEYDKEKVNDKLISIFYQLMAK